GPHQFPFSRGSENRAPPARFSEPRLNDGASAAKRVRRRTNMAAKFELDSKFQPAGDQPQAIEKIEAGFRDSKPCQVLLEATGTGKTFSAANVIARLGKPTLVLSHNKTLAAQLYKEFKGFFPRNAVHYFISYYDYYQPEAYIPQRDIYIEKDALVNENID